MIRKKKNCFLQKIPKKILLKKEGTQTKKKQKKVVIKFIYLFGGWEKMDEAFIEQQKQLIMSNISALTERLKEEVKEKESKIIISP